MHLKQYELAEEEDEKEPWCRRDRDSLSDASV